MAPHMLHRVGRRGAFLLYLTLLDVIYGSAMAFPTPSTTAAPAYVFLASIAPLQIWGWLWITTGVVCAVHAFKAADGVGFGAAMFIKVLWGTVFLLGWAFTGVERGYLSATIWLGFAAIVYLISTWPDEPQATR